MSVTRNEDGSVEFQWGTTDGCLLHPTDGLLTLDDGLFMPFSEVPFNMLTTKEGRALLAEAILALDDPIKWKNVGVFVPPQHRATPRGNEK